MENKENINTITILLLSLLTCLPNTYETQPWDLTGKEEMLKEARSTPQPKCNVLVLRTKAKIMMFPGAQASQSEAESTQSKGTHTLESTWETTAWRETQLEHKESG